MTKIIFLFFILLWVYPLSYAEEPISEFEAELRTLEKQEMAQDEKADNLVSKLSDNQMIEDKVSDEKAGTLKQHNPDAPPAPISQESLNVKKIRRVPSR